MTSGSELVARVVLEHADDEGLSRMIAGLLEANVGDDPAKARLLEDARGAVQVDVVDAGVTVGLKFVPGTVTVTSAPVPGADVRLTTDAQTLLGLSAVPLRLGLPDPLTARGRGVVAAALTGRLRVRGLPWRLGVLTRVNRLLNVAEGRHE